MYTPTKLLFQLNELNKITNHSSFLTVAQLKENVLAMLRLFKWLQGP